MNPQLMKKIFPQQVELVSQGKCPLCSKDIDPESFRDDVSRREFKISGICQSCQDEIFKS